MDGPYFIGSFRLPPYVLQVGTSAEWHLNVKDIEYDVGQTKTYFITVSMQKISSIHALIQQSLESHQLNNHAHS